MSSDISGSGPPPAEDSDGFTIFPSGQSLSPQGRSFASSSPSLVEPCIGGKFSSRTLLSIDHFDPDSAERISRVFATAPLTHRIMMRLENCQDLIAGFNKSSTKAETTRKLIDIAKEYGEIVFRKDPIVSLSYRLQQPYFCLDLWNFVDPHMMVKNTPYGFIKFIVQDYSEIRSSFVVRDPILGKQDFFDLTTAIVPAFGACKMSYRHRWTKKGFFDIKTPTPTQQGAFVLFDKPLPSSLLGKTDLRPISMQTSPINFEMICSIAKPLYADKVRLRSSLATTPSSQQQQSNADSNKSSNAGANTSAKNSAAPNTPKPKNTLSFAQQGNAVASSSNATNGSSSSNTASASQLATPSTPSNAQLRAGEAKTPIDLTKNKSPPPVPPKPISLSPNGPKEPFIVPGDNPVARNSKKRGRKSRSRANSKETLSSPSAATPPSTKSRITQSMDVDTDEESEYVPADEN